MQKQANKLKTKQEERWEICYMLELFFVENYLNSDGCEKLNQSPQRRDGCHHEEMCQFATAFIHAYLLLSS